MYIHLLTYILLYQSSVYMAYQRWTDTSIGISIGDNQKYQYPYLTLCSRYQTIDSLSVAQEAIHYQRLSLKHLVILTDNSYQLYVICIEISISKIFSSVLGMEKSCIGPSLVHTETHRYTQIDHMMHTDTSHDVTN